MLSGEQIEEMKRTSGSWKLQRNRNVDDATETEAAVDKLVRTLHTAAAYIHTSHQIARLTSSKIFPAGCCGAGDRDDMEALEDESRAADEKTGVQPIISPQNPIPEPDKSCRRGSRIDINNLAS
ncbi:hypothetical protein RB195_005659 [Necator americanus]|uniref:Uncharacterized protein n=1 Tax=Necator americanus TaxID=51031 RepID=A0ABR1BQH2_NECAM